jgi:4-amino-4-deoxy-L-arabinose transferase-like glycosyltransferase
MPRARPAVSPRAMWRRCRPPGPLAAILGIIAILGLCWALIVPPWQSPDELSHYAYVEGLATGPRLAGNPHRPIFSSDETVAIQSVDASNGAFYPNAVPPSWSRAEYRAYLDSSSTRRFSMRDNGAGPSSSSANPPLYYLLGTVGYLLAGGRGTAYARLYGIRLEGIVWLLLTGLGAWLLAGEAFGRRRLPQLLTAASTALLPMVSFMSTNVNPDALTITEWTFAMWLFTRIVRRAARFPDLAALGALLAAAILTKAVSYALVPPALLAVAIGIWRRPADRRLATLGAAAGSALITVIPVGAWLAVSRSIGGTGVTAVGTGGKPVNVRQFLSYLWQFYLPRLPFMRPMRLVPGLPAITIWLDQTIGDFGWLSVMVPAWLVLLAKILFGLLSLVTLRLLWVLRRLRGLRGLDLVAVYLLAGLSLLVLLHVTEYRQWLGTDAAFLQGRYILPLASLLGLALGLAVSRLRTAARAPFAALVLVGLLAAQALSLATVVHAYYV